MKRAVLAVLLSLAVLGIVQAQNTEPYFVAVSATTTSQIATLPGPCTSVCLCNQGTDTVYFRLFTDSAVAAAATSADARLPAGEAADPYCMCFTFNGSSEGGTGYLHTAIIADSGTATVDVTAK